MSSKGIQRLVLAAVIVTAAACQDLVVPNNNDPDRFRALANPTDVEALISSAFDEFFAAIHGTGNGVTLFPVYSSESEYTNIAGAITSEAAEPRQAHANLVSLAATIGAHGPREYYGDLMAVWSLGDDLLRVTSGPQGLRLIIDGVDQTPRAQAFAKMIQGFAIGELANMYDQTIFIPTEAVFPESTEEALQYIVTADEALEAAIGLLEDAKQILQDNPDILFPDRSAGSDQWFGTPTPVGPAELIPFINTMIARYLVMHARNPAERAATDWHRVLSYTQNGLKTQDFVIQLDGARSSPYYGVLQRQPTSNPFAIDNRLAGQADTTGAYQAWINAPLHERNKFLPKTPDKRLMGPETVTVSGVTYPEPGAYARFLTSDSCCNAAGAGNYRLSALQWRRHAHENNNFGMTAGPAQSGNTGVARIATVDENNLYAAEAYFHLGDLEAARELVNITRTRPHRLPSGETYPGLPPATINGATHSAPGLDNCVPRTDSGACGDLHVVIRYERMIELMGLNITRGFYDSRAFGLLPDDSWVQLPMPAPELEQLGLDLYQFGGPDDPTAAVYAPVGGANPNPKP